MEKAKPQPPVIAPTPLEAKEPTKSWHFAEHLLEAPISLGDNPHSLFSKGKVDDVIYVNLLAAAKYAYESYLSKPYTLRESTKSDKNAWQMDWEYKHPTKGTLIPRPNHGLAHTLRKLFYLPRVLEHYIAHQTLSEQVAKPGLPRSLRLLAMTVILRKSLPSLLP